MPAPPRFFGTYDNLWLSHEDRARIVDGGGPPVRASKGDAGVLFVDGFHRANWAVRDGELVLEPPLRDDAVAAEGERLLAFLAG